MASFNIKKLIGLTTVFFVGSVLAACVCLLFGAVQLNLRDILMAFGAGAEGAPVSYEIVVNQRTPRILLAFLAGGSLAIAGAVFQALLRNPLATPHTLGVSAGGALGAATAIFFDISLFRIGSFSSVQIFALIGSMCAMGVIYLLARRRENFSTMKLLLAGVTMALISSALIMFVRYMAAPRKLVTLDRWLMGGLDIRGYRSLSSVLPIMLPALALLLCQVEKLNHLSFGDELARGRGINVTQVQITAFIGGSALTAAVVSVAGPIGFVGLIVPHAFRLLLGPDHRPLFISSFFGGGTFLVIADTFARTILSPAELPVGVLTAMLGGPFFLFLLARREF